MPLKGACLCKAVQVEVADDFLPLRFSMCFCQNCATAHSAPGCLVAGMLTKFLKISGPLSTYRDTNTDSGKAVMRAFCTSCGTPVRSWPEGNTDVTALRAGLFAMSTPNVSLSNDMASATSPAGFVFPQPVEELFTERRNEQFPWLAAQEGAKQYSRKGAC
ncbi:hypothetical protein CF326_g7105 [Tilletia indica]|nr:hypothetical protein CF326_g7105 [Tilletia indica]